jgi:hypothetical protein
MRIKWWERKMSAVRYSTYVVYSLRIVALTSVFFAGCAPSKWIEVQCTDVNGFVRIPRDASASYEVYGTEYESGYRACMSALRSIVSARSNADSLGIAIESFRKYLPKERNAFRTRLPETVERLQNNPCDNKGLESLRILRETLDINARGLRTIAAACKDTSLDLVGIIDEYKADND